VNYAPNTHRWQPGDVVIHDADAKRVEMLMLVKGYHPHSGLCITQYMQRDFLPGMKKKRYLNEPRFLHSPALFGLPTSVPQEEASRNLAEANPNS